MSLNNPFELNFDIPLDDVNTTQDKTKVPNTFPTNRAEYKIAIIGEAPGPDEEDLGRPFVGKAGGFLNGILSGIGIDRDACYVGNVCPYKPPANDITKFDPFGPERSEGLADLKNEIKEFDPNLVLLLGDTAVKAAGFKHTVNKLRGSVLKCDDLSSPVFGYKCLTTYHPAAILRMYSWKPYFIFDLTKAKTEGLTPELNTTKRDFVPQPGYIQALDYLDSLLVRKPKIALDIEGNVNFVKCISFSEHPTQAVNIPIKDYSNVEQVQVLRKLTEVLSHPEIPKVMQNGMFDRFVLGYTYGIHVANVVDDTMLAQWELYPELAKGLGVQVSIWTDQPYYKDEINSDSNEGFYRYCCMDSATTLEISNKQLAVLGGKPLEHYRFNMALTNPLLYAEFRGIKYDYEAAAKELALVKHKMSEVQRRIDIRNGAPINLNSPKQVCVLFYDKLGLPVQHPKKKKGHGLDRSRRTTDVNACLKLLKDYRENVVADLLHFRALEKTRQALEITYDEDKRIRCSYNPVGTDTGRLSCSQALHGTGTNLQTVTKKLRHLYRADDGYYFFQADLEGADGWTVAAECAALNDHRMFEDYKQGLKPAKILSLMYEHGEVVNTWDYEKLREESKGVDGNGWLYFTCKRVQHGTNYLLGIPTMIGQIAKDSYKINGKPIYVKKADAVILQELYISRYPGVIHRQRHLEYTFKHSKGFPAIEAASGHIRRFFGRPTEHTTLRAACAQTPQANTTYATNAAILQLWNDPDNRTPSGDLIIQPLHQVHDAVCGQFPCDRAAWACGKIKSYFNNPITIGDLTFTIPFDGEYGPSWGELKHQI